MAAPQYIHLIRHGQSTFNEAYELTGQDPIIWDAPISELGARQIAALAAQLRSDQSPLVPPPARVLVSPLTRALQTAEGLFSDVAVPVEVEPLLTEQVTESCDIGSDKTDLLKNFPHANWDFSRVPDDRPWWPVDLFSSAEQRDASICRSHFLHAAGFIEGELALRTRTHQLVRRLQAYPEKSLCLVGHADMFNCLQRVLALMAQGVGVAESDERIFEEEGRREETAYTEKVLG